MDLDRLKSDIKAGHLHSVNFESMLVQDLDTRLVSNKSEGDFFSKLINLLFGNGCTSCASMCASCSSGCAPDGCSSGGCSSAFCSQGCVNSCSNGASLT